MRMERSFLLSISLILFFFSRQLAPMNMQIIGTILIIIIIIIIHIFIIQMA